MYERWEQRALHRYQRRRRPLHPRAQVGSQLHIHLLHPIKKMIRKQRLRRNLRSIDLGQHFGFLDQSPRTAHVSKGYSPFRAAAPSPKILHLRKIRDIFEAFAGFKTDLDGKTRGNTRNSPIATERKQIVHSVRQNSRIRRKIHSIRISVDRLHWHGILRRSLLMTWVAAKGLTKANDRPTTHDVVTT